MKLGMQLTDIINQGWILTAYDYLDTGNVACIGLWLSSHALEENEAWGSL